MAGVKCVGVILLGLFMVHCGTRFGEICCTVYSIGIRMLYVHFGLGNGGV